MRYVQINVVLLKTFYCCYHVYFHGILISCYIEELTDLQSEIFSYELCSDRSSSVAMNFEYY